MVLCMYPASDEIAARIESFLRGKWDVLGFQFPTSDITTSVGYNLPFDYTCVYCDCTAYASNQRLLLLAPDTPPESAGLLCFL